MNALPLNLLWCVAQITVLTLATASGYWLMRKQSSQLRTSLLQATFVLVSGLSLLAFSPWPNWWPTPNAIKPESATIPDVDASQAAPTTTVNEPGKKVPATFNDTELETPAQAFLTGLAKSIRTPPVSKTEPEQREAVSWPRIFTWGFFCVVGLRLLVLMWDAWQVFRLRRQSVAVTDLAVLDLLAELKTELNCLRGIELRNSDQLNTAAASGWFRPVILLSSSWQEWTPEQLRGILAHEISHLQTYDTLSVLLSELALAFHFYHPLLHWLNRRFHLEQEFQADATAARSTGGEENYLRILAQLALSQDSRSTPRALPTFLTSQSPLLRRIEMLQQPLPATVSRTARAVLLAGMVLLGLGLAGLRSPEAKTLLADEPEPPAIAAEGPLPASPVKRADESASLSTLAWVPKETIWLASVDLDGIRRHKPLTQLLATLNEGGGLKETIGMSTNDISRFQLTMMKLPADNPGEKSLPTAGFILHTKQPIDVQTCLKNLTSADNIAARTHGQHAYFQTSHTTYVAFPSPRVMLIGDRVAGIKALLDAGEKGSTIADWVGEWKQVSQSEVSILGRLSFIEDELDKEMENGPQFEVAGMFTPLWRETETLGLSLSMKDQFQLSAFASTQNAVDAKKVRRTVEALLTLAENGLANLKESRNRIGREDREMLSLIEKIAEPALASAEVKQKGNQVTLHAKLDKNSTTSMLKTLLPAVTSARLAARRSQSMNNMKQIALAFHNYHEVYNRLPPAVVMGPDGKTPHSWRVEILPYLDQAALYQQYRLNEPWDSDHNKKILAKMPAVFRHPVDQPNSTNAGYFVLTGENTMFGVKGGTRFRDVTDGMSNTILTVSAKRDIPWTKPADIPYDSNKAVPKFGGYFKEGFEVGISDGSVRFVSHEVAEKILRLLITRNDGKPVPEF